MFTRIAVAGILSFLFKRTVKSIPARCPEAINGTFRTDEISTSSRTDISKQCLLVFGKKTSGAGFVRNRAREEDQ